MHSKIGIYFFHEEFGNLENGSTVVHSKYSLYGVPIVFVVILDFAF